MYWGFRNYRGVEAVEYYGKSRKKGLKIMKVILSPKEQVKFSHSVFLPTEPQRSQTNVLTLEAFSSFRILKF